MGTDGYRRIGLLVIAGVGAMVMANDPAIAGPNQTPGAIWNLTSGLSEDQRTVNRLVHGLLPPDDCDLENEFDAEAHGLAVRRSSAALRDLRALERRGGRESQAAAGRAFVFMAQRAIAEGNHDLAAGHALHVYLSGVPHRLRMEALRAYVSSANPKASLHWIGLIEAGRQDVHFQPMLDDLRSLRRARMAGG